MFKKTKYAAITPYMVFSVVVYLQGALLFGMLVPVVPLHRI